MVTFVSILVVDDKLAIANPFNGVLSKVWALRAESHSLISTRLWGWPVGEGGEWNPLSFAFKAYEDLDVVAFNPIEAADLARVIVTLEDFIDHLIIALVGVCTLHVFSLREPDAGLTPEA
ncbi:MAG: hypothetical protein QXT64_01575 [Desulfurococcaceae archaeon]